MAKMWTRADAQAEINRAAKKPVESFKKFCAELKSAVEEIIRIGKETGFEADAACGLEHLLGCMRMIEKTFIPHFKQPTKAEDRQDKIKDKAPSKPRELWADRGCQCGACQFTVDTPSIIHGVACPLRQSDLVLKRVSHKLYVVRDSTLTFTPGLCILESELKNWRERHPVALLRID